jgi:pyruvate dehydrogenase E1 component subunit alpha
MNAEDLARLEREVAKEVDDSIAFAEAGTWEPVEDLTRFVCSEKPAKLEPAEPERKAS